MTPPKWNFYFNIYIEWGFNSYHNYKFVNYKLFYKFIKILYPIFSIKKIQLMWKDKYNTPRLEFKPSIYFNFCYMTFQWTQGQSDIEWEFYLWVTKYNDNDLQKGIETWPWKRVKSTDEIRDEKLKSLGI